MSAGAHLFGISTSLLGVGAYVVLIASGIASILARSDRMISIWFAAGYAVALVGTLVSVSLTAYSVLYVHTVCFWCLGSAIVMTLTFGSYALIGAYAPSRSALRDPLALLSTGVLLFLVFIGAAGTAVYLDKTATTAQISPFALAAIPPGELVPPKGNVIGSPAARHTLVFFGDLECPLCHEWFPKVKALTARYGARLVYRHLPLPIHPLAFQAAVRAEQAGQCGHFWEFLDEACSMDLDGDSLDRLSSHFISQDKLTSTEKAAQARVRADLALDAKLRITHTPTMILLDGQAPPRTVSLLGLEEGLAH